MFFVTITMVTTITRLWFRSEDDDVHYFYGHDDYDHDE